MATSSLAFCALVLLLGSASAQFERDQTAEGCYEKVMDIWFILDSSTSIYVNDFTQEHQFVRDVVTRLDIRPSATRVGLLTFSDDITRPTLGLNRNQNKADVLTSVNNQNLPYRTGITNTDLAIRYVRENTEFRQDITKVIVVITDGGSRSPGSTARESELAREQGFYLFVVGVGQYLDEREWRAIASDPDDSFIYNITNFRFLNTVRSSIAPRACALPPIIVGGYCNVEQRSDLYFVAAPGGTQEAVQLIDNFIERSDDRNSYLRVSYLLDICNDNENVRLQDFSEVCNRFGVTGETSPDTFVNQLNRMRTLARRERQTGRIGNQVAVLFIDSESIRLNRFGIDREAREARNEGIKLIVVDLGSRGFSNFIQNIAGDRNNRYNVVTFQPGSLSSQRSVQKLLLDNTCDAINEIDFRVQPSK